MLNILYGKLNLMLLNYNGLFIKIENFKLTEELHHTPIYFYKEFLNNFHNFYLYKNV